MYKNQDNSLPVSLKQDNNNIPKLSVEKYFMKINN